LNTLSALISLLALDRLPRTGWALAGVEDPETIAGHVLSTAHLVLALAPRVEPPLDVDRAIALTVIHDSPEAWTGDLPKYASEQLPPGAKKQLEARVADSLLASLSQTARARHEEYARGESRESSFVRLCDKLQLGIQLLVYRRAGRGDLDDFIETLKSLDTSAFEPVDHFHSELLSALENCNRESPCD
jgi:putative hydrolase of HD superfamily